MEGADVKGADAEPANSGKGSRGSASPTAKSSSSTQTNSSSSRPVPPAAATATGADASNSSTGTAAGAEGAGTKPGRRRLQGRATNSFPAAAAQGKVGGGRVLSDTASEAASDASESDPVLADADLQTTAAGSAGQGAVLSRQGSSIMLQPSSSCSFQYMVTRNPTLLQVDPQAAARAESAVGASRRHSNSRSSGSSSSWWVSLGALFAGVSAVLALGICYMSSQLWARYKVSTGPDLGW
jgi:hypothetical protein